MKTEIRELDDLADLIYQCFSGVEIKTSEYLDTLSNSTLNEALEAFKKENNRTPDEDDIYDIHAIHWEIMAKEIFNSFEHVFVENDQCYAVKDGVPTMIYENMKEFNWFE